MKPLAILSVLAGLCCLPTARAEEPAGKAAVDGAKPAAAAEPERARAPDYRALLAPTPATRAVDRGLEYLARTQLPDGSWLSYMGKNTGIVGLAVMAFLAAGHEPGRGRFGENIDRGVSFLLGAVEDGMIVTADRSHGPMYEHGIATLLLGEVAGMVNEEHPAFEKIARVHRSAVNLILRAQNVPKEASANGGWRYTPSSTDSDLSVTGWELLALRAAENAGLPVPRRNIEQAVVYVKRCAHRSGGFCYMPGGEPNIARTGTGILALQLAGDFKSPEAIRGGDWLLKNPLEPRGPFFFYAVYYSTQAMYQLGGHYWEAWRPLSEGILLKEQKPDGSWPPLPYETHEHQAGAAYTTAMAILSLTVDYKYLPIYQR
jgi:hypothetical protein